MKLGDVCEIVSGATPKTKVPEYWDGAIKWITPAEIEDNTHIVYDTRKHLTDCGFSSANLRLFPEGTVLLSTRAPIGKVAIAGSEMCCNQGFKNLICSHRINNEYLYRYLKSKTSELQALGRGATFKELSKKNVERFKIFLPSIKCQQEIVSKLASIERSIFLVNQQIGELNRSIKSKFIPIESTIRNCLNSGNWDTTFFMILLHIEAILYIGKTLSNG